MTRFETLLPPGRVEFIELAGFDLRERSVPVAGSTFCNVAHRA